VTAPDGLSDLMMDSMQRGRVELYVRWDGGAKGRKSRRVPITPKLAAALKRYEARHRPDGLARTGGREPGHGVGVEPAPTMGGVGQSAALSRDVLWT
jgi:integrase